MNRPDISSSQQAFVQARAFTQSDVSGGKAAARILSDTLTAPHTCRVFNSIDDVDLDAWRRVCAESGASVFMDPRFIAAVETGMKDCRFWYVIVDGDDSQPVACACLTATMIDLLDFTDPRLAWVIRHGPKMLSRFRHLKVLFCSLPGSPGEKSIAFASKAASPQVLAALDDVMDRLAAANGSDVIIYKEFTADDLDPMQPLLVHGFRRIEIPPMHCLEPSFESFAQYCAALRANYRMQITRSTKKLRNSGIEQVVFTEPQDILRVYTPDVHAMYCEMVGKSDLKVEVLPIEYYRQLTLRLAGQIELVTLARDSKIIGFGWCLRDTTTYHMMYAGLNYELNREFDLYFNLMFAGFDRALRSRATKINVGQTATVFKARMGCHSEPRHVYMKGVGPLMSRLFYYGANLMVIKKPSNPPSDIFKREGGEGLK
jgi:predicted N-acyltransferase